MRGKPAGRWTAATRATALVVAEVGIAATVLVGAGLLARSLFELLSVDPGFDARPVLSAILRLPEARYPDDDRLRTFAAGIVEEVAVGPGVARAAVTSRLPMAPQGGDTYFAIEGEPVPAEGKPTRRHPRGLARLFRDHADRGRTRPRLRRSDAHGAPRAVVVNEPFVRRFFGGGDPVGSVSRSTWARPSSPRSSASWKACGSTR
jgi:hypothetical protein